MALAALTAHDDDEAARSGPAEPLARTAAEPGPAAPALAAAHAIQPVGALISSAGAVSPATLTRDVAERFFRDHALEALALVDRGRPVGLITRPRLLLKLARGFGHELYARKPIARIADADPLVVTEDAGVVTTVAAALDRAPDALYDEVIVVDSAGGYLGLLSVRALVLQQGLALARSAAEREAALARAHDLETLDRLRAQFLAHATHELRSPVNVVVGVAELVRRHAEKGAWHQVAARLPLLQRSAATLRTTVNNILDLSKLEAGKAEVTIGPVELPPLLEDVAGMARLLAGEKPLAVVLEDEAAPPEFPTDGLKLRQIITNLATNAVKFTPRGRVTLGAAGEPGGLRLWVTDTGIGIRQEDLARLFTPFGQLADPASRQHEGTGLGLVITRSMVQLLGGRIEVESRHGEGTTVTVQLPRAEEAPP
jgi:signal transduction histidine kinase